MMRTLLREHRALLFSIALFAALIAYLLFAAAAAGRGAEGEQLQIVDRAVWRAVMQCYAVEGAYPSDLQYLVDHYGLSVDPERYTVHYFAQGANLRPDVRVFPIEA